MSRPRPYSRGGLLREPQRISNAGITLPTRCGTGPALKFKRDRAPSDTDSAARRIVEIANSIEDIQGRIHIEKINGPFLRDPGTPVEYRAGLARAIEKGWLVLHESGTHVKFTQGGADLFA